MMARKLMEPLAGEETFKHIPVRFYLAGTDNAASGQQASITL